MKKQIFCIALISITTIFTAEISIGCFSQKGSTRNENQDRLISANIQNNYLMGIFDGHGGDQVSQFLQDNITREFNQNRFDDIKDKLANTLLTLNDKVKHIEAGSTAALLYIETKYELGKNKVLFHTAHVGDSRIILINEQGIIVLATNDHKPNRPDEHERIVKNGGVISPRIWENGIEYQVIFPNYALTMSRVIGDHFIDENKQIISAVSEYSKKVLEGFYYFIIGSDGLYDVMTNEELGKCVVENKEEALSGLAELLVKNAVKKGSCDDITLIVGRIKTE